jgi:anti-sigma B factor antagonist
LHAATHPIEFALDVVPDRQQVIVAVTGEVDVATADRVGDAIAELRASGWQRIVLDLRDCGFMDSQGLHLLLDWDADARRAGWELLIGATSSAVDRLLDVAAPHRLRRVERGYGGRRF